MNYPGRRWRTISSAKVYNIERAADGPELVWKFMTTTTKRETSVNIMVSGNSMYRVAAAGPVGQGPWSEPVALFAP
jgi:hypothetical protein